MKHIQADAPAIPSKRAHEEAAELDAYVALVRYFESVNATVGEA